MRKISTSLAAACVAAAAALGSFAPVAGAQTAPAQPAPAQTSDFVQLIRLLNGEISNVDCGALGTALRVSGMANRETTRSQLVTKVNKAIGADAAVRVVTAPTVNALGDRALKCGIVKPDPVGPFDQFLDMSSKRSSDAGLPVEQLKMLAGALK